MALGTVIAGGVTVGQVLYAAFVLGVSILMRVIAWQGRPDAPAGKLRGILATSMDTQAPLPLVYGTHRVGINIVYQGLEGGNNAYLHVIGNLCEGEINCIHQALVENYVIVINADNKTIVMSYDGGAPATITLAEGSYYAAYLATELQGKIDTYLFCSSTVTWDSTDRKYTIAAALGHTIAYTHSGSTIAATIGFTADHAAAASITTDVAIGTGATSALQDQIWLNDKFYTDYGSKFTYEFFNGSSTQTLCATLAALIPEWDSANRYTAYLYMRFEYDPDLYQSRPEVTAEIEGLKIYNPATGLTAYSNNPALCARDMLTRSSRRGGLGIAAERIDDQAVMEAAAYCDNKGWTCDLILNEKEAAIDNLRKILSCFRGTLIYDGTKFKLKYRDLNYEASVMDITEDDIIDAGGSTLRITQPSIFQTPNAVLMKYKNAEKRYADDEYLLADNPSITADGDYREREIAVPGITGTANVVKMATYYLERLRINKTAGFVMGSRGMALEPEDLVCLTHPRPGWDKKLFRVTEPTIAPTGEVGVILEEEDVLMYNDIADLSAHNWHNTNLPNPMDAVPSVINVTNAEEVYNYRDRSFTRWKVDFDRPLAATYPWWDHADIWIKQNENGWEVNGVQWTGAIVTVGPGKDYETISAATAAATADTLFLIYAGTYDESFSDSTSYKFYFKNVDDPGDVVIADGKTFNCGQYVSSKEFIIEGITFAGSYPITTYKYAVGTISKCRGTQADLMFMPANDGGSYATVTVRYSYAARNIITITTSGGYYSDTRSMSIHRCESPNVPSSSYGVLR